jgi:hypothetical protein
VPSQIAGAGQARCPVVLQVVIGSHCYQHRSRGADWRQLVDIVTAAGA